MKVMDLVMINEDFPDKGLSKWHIGTIVDIYNDFEYELEFINSDGKTTFLRTVSRKYFELIWNNESKSYIGRFKLLLDIFTETRSILSDTAMDMTWTSYPDKEAFIKKFDELVEGFKKGINDCAYKLRLLFCPTGVLQTLSLCNGWSEKYLELAARFEKLI